MKNITLFFFVVVLCAFFMGATQVHAFWNSGGPYGGYVNCMAMAATNPDIIYAGTDSGLFKTVDGGDTWTRTGFPELIVGVVQATPDNPDIIYAGTDDGIYKSEDGGNTWTRKGLSEARVNAIAIDPLNHDILYAGTGKPRQVSIVGVFKSMDGGETWEKKLSEKERSRVTTLLIDTENSSYVYAGVEDGRAGLWMSTNGGDTWTGPVSSGYPVLALAMTPADFSSTYIFAVVDGAFDHDDVYATPDRFETWASTGAPSIPWNPPWALAVDHNDPLTLYVGAGGSLYKRPAGTDTWLEKANGLPPPVPSSIVIDPRNSDVLYASFSEGGVYNSTDGAESWSISSQGMNNTFIEGLAVHPTSSDTVFAAIKGDGHYLAKTTNGGASWGYLVNSRTDRGAVAIDPQNSSTIYAGFGWRGRTNRIYSIDKSTNGGQSWTSTGYLFSTIGYHYVGVSDIWVSPSDSSTILVAVAGYPTVGGGVYRSTDGGATWEHPRKLWATTLAADPTNDQILYFGTQHCGYVKRSTDGGSSWSDISPSAPPLGNVRSRRCEI